MRLSDLFNISDEDDTEVLGLACDSSKVERGFVFFCLVGQTSDGHTFAQEAVSRGAVAVVVERRLAVDCVQIETDNARKALALCAGKFFGNPAKRMKLIGITGTNGKTTTTYIVKSIIEAAGHSCGLIGTNAVEYGGNEIEPTLTTPDPIDLHRTLHDMATAGIEYVVMEVSAHALALNKVDGITYEVAAFTNFSRDHLDFFGDMNAYAQAKKSFFTIDHAKRAVINADDSLGSEIIRAVHIPTITYGVDNPSDVFGIDLEMSAYGLSYVINMTDRVGKVKFNLTGRFNMYNTLCAAAIAEALDMPFSAVIAGIRNVKKVDGRFNIINTAKCSVIIDFAHTDDGIANILRAIREFAPARIITVFGCGGNRDKTKRAVMGKIVSTLSDYCYVTSDNPRFEPPLDIILQIESGIKEIGNTNYTTIVDRKEAIRAAINMAEKNDIVLIAGKGAEKYNDVMGRKQPYNDEKYVLEIAGESGF
ncbi:MAG: UDP-N-acetylmuramoyl-L-alanyl-D-glutamate--2,6-diaminopimelate ligase [Clostridiales bacterium]|nr:UDP-N-acetylmuramoyl-L-alanyl-D-glutamate--2,6-diaminopimelate ligase [Clostridiales bacterium]